ncbi:MAG: hypothetical protein AAGG11_00635 [Pseudomonadota bacterium]
MAKFKVPTEEAVTGILQMFVPDAEAKSGGADSYAFVGEFVDDEGELVSVCYSDFAASAGLGSALSMIPPAAAEEMLSSGELTPIAQDNLYEVMNIFSTVFMDDSTPHLKLVRVSPFADFAGADALGDARTVELSVQLGGYGDGALSFKAI